jgi:hypothetical protein
MRDLGSPLQSRRFFDEIIRTFPERARILSVWLGSTPVVPGSGAVDWSEFGLVQTVVLGNFSVKPLDCLEILSLVGVIDRLTEKEVL